MQRASALPSFEEDCCTYHEFLEFLSVGSCASLLHALRGFQLVCSCRACWFFASGTVLASTVPVALERPDGPTYVWHSTRLQLSHQLSRPFRARSLTRVRPLQIMTRGGNLIAASQLLEHAYGILFDLRPSVLNDNSIIMKQNKKEKKK